jgi:hypothetical protein
LPSPGNTYVTVGESGPILLRAVPEASTMLLLGSGLVGVIARRWHQVIPRSGTNARMQNSSSGS